MDKAQLQHLIQSYKQYESRFFLSNQDASDGYLYGEVGFCLAGLKPAVLIDFPAPLLDQYMAAVMIPWLAQWNNSNSSSSSGGGGGAGNLLDGTTEWQVVHRHVTSPEVNMPVVFFVHATDPRLTHSLMGLHFRQQDERLNVQDEDDLAELLDYPGRLPRSLDDLETMREVVYYDQHTRLVLTTFAAQLDQQLQVRRHFDAYTTVMTDLGIHLGLIFRRPAA